MISLVGGKILRVTSQRKLYPWLFTHLSGCYLGTPRKNFRVVWAEAVKPAGLPHMLKHDFRRTAVRNTERASVSRSVAMKITGHKTESVYRRYAIVSDADLQAATQKLTGTNPGTNTLSSVDCQSQVCETSG